MNKPELIEKLSKDLGFSKTQVEKWVDSLNDIIAKNLKSGDKIVLSGFGTFLVSFRKSRKGRNPKTGAVIHLEASQIPHFRAGKEFKKNVNQNF